MAATEARNYRLRQRRRLAGVSWLVAGLGALGAQPGRAQSHVDLLTLLYRESDHRTQVLEQMLLVHHELGDSLGVVDLTLTHDAISGASPTGAYPKLDVTTSASGTKSSAAFPLARDDNQRNAGAFAYGRKLGAHLPMVDVSYSRENDYVARTVGLSDAWTLLGGRGTLHYGVSQGSDLSEPITNQLHLPKKSLSFAAGWTWIVDADTLLDVSATHTRLHGYLDEPYKVVPVGAVTVPDHRPGQRTRDAALFKYGHYFLWEGALRASYRYYRDDWAVRAHTLDVIYEQRLGDGWTLAPEVRFYTQTAAAFYASRFSASQAYLSSDYRLSPFDSVLGGLTLGWEVQSGLVLKLGGSVQQARGRDRSTPLATGSVLGPGAQFSGPASSSADLTKLMVTFGLSWRY